MCCSSLEFMRMMVYDMLMIDDLCERTSDIGVAKLRECRCVEGMFLARRYDTALMRGEEMNVAPWTSGRAVLLLPQLKVVVVHSMSSSHLSYNILIASEVVPLPRTRGSPSAPTYTVLVIPIKPHGSVLLHLPPSSNIRRIRRSSSRWRWNFLLILRLSIRALKTLRFQI